jgi:hypothetical protein
MMSLQQGTFIYLGIGVVSACKSFWEARKGPSPYDKGLSVGVTSFVILVALMVHACTWPLTVAAKITSDD